MADALGVPPYVVFSDATLSEMAQKKPVSEAQMKAVSGIGAEKFRRYGETFINEILAFDRQNPQSKTKLAKGITYIETFELYKAGYSVKVIGEKRGLNPVTILSHLVKLKEDGHSIDLKALIDDKAYQAITKAAQEMSIRKEDPLKPLFELLNEQYDYGQIKLALAVWGEENA